MRLSKSLEELDAVADELLAKSKAAEEDVSPEDIVDDAPSTPESDTDDVDDEDEDNEPEDDKDTEDDVKKSEESEDIDEDDEEDDEDDEEDEDEDEDDEEDVRKSLQERFAETDVLQKSINSSELFAAVVEVLSKSLNDMQYDVQYNGRQQTAASDVIAKSMQAVISSNANLKAENEKLSRRLNRLEKSVSEGFEDIMDSLEEISSQPSRMRKSMASINVQERDFDHSIHGQSTVGGFESLSKAQVLNVLNTELYAGNPNVSASDIISYESGAPLRSDLQAFVESKCK